MSGYANPHLPSPSTLVVAQQAAQVVRPGFELTRLWPLHVGLSLMVHFPVIPVTVPASSAAQITAARGKHTLTLGAGDMPALLKQAMPLLPWGAAGGDTTLPYCEFLSLMLGVLWMDSDGVDKSLSGWIHCSR